ncbi:MAG: head GIN domain-containing protein [Bacteroidota bacterium]
MRKYIILSFIIPLLTTTQLWAQGTESVDLSSFRALRVVGKIQLTAVEGSENRLEMEARGISVDKVQISQSKEELKIKVSPLISKDYQIIARLTYTELDKLSASAGAEIEVTELLQVDILNLQAGSGAEIDVEAVADLIYQRAAEGAIIKIEGSAERAEIKAATGGIVRAEDLQVSKVFAKVSTGGEVEIQVEEELDVTSSTGGEFIYSGSPSKSYTQSSLGGIIRKE